MWRVRYFVTMKRYFFTIGLLAGTFFIIGCQRQDTPPSEMALAEAWRKNPIEAVKQQLNDRIERYRRGEAAGIPRGGSQHRKSLLTKYKLADDGVRAPMAKIGSSVPIP